MADEKKNSGGKRSRLSTPVIRGKSTRRADSPASEPVVEEVPSGEVAESAAESESTEVDSDDTEEEAPAKRGWFGGTGD